MVSQFDCELKENIFICFQIQGFMKSINESKMEKLEQKRCQCANEIDNDAKQFTAAFQIIIKILQLTNDSLPQFHSIVETAIEECSLQQSEAQCRIIREKFESIKKAFDYKPNWTIGSANTVKYFKDLKQRYSQSPSAFFANEDYQHSEGDARGLIKAIMFLLQKGRSDNSDPSEILLLLGLLTPSKQLKCRCFLELWNRFGTCLYCYTLCIESLNSAGRWAEAMDTLHEKVLLVNYDQANPELLSDLHAAFGNLFEQYYDYQHASIYYKSALFHNRMNLSAYKGIASLYIVKKINRKQFLPQLQEFKKYYPNSELMLACEALFTEIKKGQKMFKEIAERITSQKAVKADFYLYDYCAGLSAYFFLNYEVSLQHFFCEYSNNPQDTNIISWIYRCYFQMKQFERSLQYCYLPKGYGFDTPLAKLYAIRNLIALRRQAEAREIANEIQSNLHEVKWRNLYSYFAGLLTLLGESSKALAYVAQFNPQQYDYFFKTESEMIKVVSFSKLGNEEQSIRSLDKAIEYLEESKGKQWQIMFQQALLVLRYCFKYNRLAEGRKIAKKIRRLIARVKSFNEPAAAMLEHQLENGSSLQSIINY